MYDSIGHTVHINVFLTK